MSAVTALKGLALWFQYVGLVVVSTVVVTATAAESPVRSIDVTRDGDAYVLKADMVAPVPPALAWEVLTDFPNMARWVPSVNDSHILKPGDTKFTVEQRGTAKFGALKFDYTSVREIELNPQTTIRSTQLKGSMKKQQSLMKLSAEGNGTLMQYQLELVPSFFASAVISEDLLKQEISEQFTAIVGEMVRRRK